MRSIPAIALLAVGAFATPPGTPVTELQAKQLALGVYYDQSGQALFEEGNPSSLNTMGVGLGYGLINFVEVGAFVGAASLKVGVPPGKETIDTFHVFNPGLGPYGGVSAKLSSPRFFTGTTRFVANGEAAYVHAKDEDGNVKQGGVYNAGATLQYEMMPRFSLILGGEFYAIDGEQRGPATTGTQPLGISIPGGTLDYFRGVVGFEYFFKGASKSFFSVVFRPTGSMGYRDGFGLEGASVAVTLGAITGFGKQTDQDDDGHSLND